MKRSILIFLFAALLFVSFLLPVILHASTMLWGKFLDVEDLEAELWLHWWLHDGISKGGDIRFINLFYYPFGIRFFHTLFISLSALAVFFKFLFPLPFYYNFFILLLTGFNYFSTYILFKRISGNRFVSASIAVFSVFSNFYFLEVNEGRLYTVMTFTLPLALYFILRLLETPSFKLAAVSALCMFLTVFNYIYYGLFLVIFLTAFLAAWLAVSKTACWRASIKYLSITLLLFTLLTLPLMAFYKNLLSEKTIGAESLKQTFILPSIDSIRKKQYSEYFAFFLNESFHPSAVFRVPDKNISNRLSMSFILTLSALLSSLFITEWKRRLPYVTVLVLFLMIWVGPYIDVDKFSPFGHSELIFKAPYYLALKLFSPLLKFPWFSRLRVFIILSLSMLIALNFSDLLRKFRGKKKALYIIAALLPFLYLAELKFFEYNYPPSMSRIYIPEFYRTLAREKDNFAIIELPLFRCQSTIFYQTVHNKPLLGGNGESAKAEIPDRTIKMVRNNTFLQYLLLATTDLSGRVSYREEDLAELKKIGFKYLVVNKINYRRLIARDTMELLCNKELIGASMYKGYFDPNNMSSRFSYNESLKTLFYSLSAKFGKPLYEDGIITAFRM